MCTPIVIDAQPIDLSGDPLRDKATAVSDGSLGTVKSDPAGTGVTAPGPAASTPTTTTAGTTAPTKDTAALAADEGRVFIPGADYPGGGATATSNVLAPLAPIQSDSGTLAVKPDKGTATDTITPPADPMADQNTLLINSLTQLAHKVSDTTTGILGAQADAASALNSGFLNLSDQQQKALDAANQLRKNTGQQARNPSYSLSAAKTRRANAGGRSSTMLTGSGGVPTNSLALGRAQLLGGA